MPSFGRRINASSWPFQRRGISCLIQRNWFPPYFFQQHFPLPPQHHHLLLLSDRVHLEGEQERQEPQFCGEYLTQRNLRFQFNIKIKGEQALSFSIQFSFSLLGVVVRFREGCMQESSSSLSSVLAKQSSNERLGYQTSFLGTSRVSKSYSLGGSLTWLR